MSRFCNRCRQVARRLTAGANPRAASAVPLPDPATFWSRVGPTDPLTGCRDWTGGRFDKGYGAVAVAGRTMGAHRVAYAMTFGQPARGQVIRHSCDRPPCCEPAHLLAGTVAQNAADMDARGRRVLSRAKITREQAVEIRRRARAGETQLALGREFGLSRSAVGAIARGDAWSG